MSRRRERDTDSWFAHRLMAQPPAGLPKCQCDGEAPALASDGRQCGIRDCRQSLTNASSSLLIWSAMVVAIPCGPPGTILRVAFFNSFTAFFAATSIGTI